MDADNFNSSVQCFVSEYDRFVAVGGLDSPTGDIHVNGRLTLSENIADNGGLQLAFAALEESNPEQKSSQLDGFTPEQRLFLGYAQTRCANMSTQFATMKAQTNDHSLPKYRVNGVVQNMPDFAHAFACKKSQPMVSDHVCRLW